MAKGTEEKAVCVLVVDDDEVDRTAVRRALGKGELKTEVREAMTASEGVKAAQSNHTDVILLDYHLPGYDAAELIPRLAPQFIAFTISSERQGFVPNMEQACRRPIQYITLFRKGAMDLEEAARRGSRSVRKIARPHLRVAPQRVRQHV